jgi:hypothetical protein
MLIRVSLAIALLLTTVFVADEWATSKPVTVSCKEHHENNRNHFSDSDICPSLRSTIFEGRRPFVVWLGDIVDEHDGAVTAISTTFIAAFTFTLFTISRRQLAHFRISERAYISGGGIGVDLNLEDNPIAFDRDGEKIVYSRKVIGGYFELHIDNYGKTPGELLEIGIGFCEAATEITELPKYRWYHFHASIKPGEKGLPLLRFAIPSEFLSPAVFGRFRYKDVYGDQRNSGFILEITHFTTLSISAPLAYTEADPPLG